MSSCWRLAGVLHSQAACVVLAGPRRSEEILLQDEGCQLLVDVLLEVLNLLPLVVGCRIFRPLIGRLDSRGVGIGGSLGLLAGAVIIHQELLHLPFIWVVLATMSLCCLIVLEAIRE